MINQEVKITEDNKIETVTTDDNGVKNSEIEFNTVLSGNKFINVIDKMNYLMRETEEGMRNLMTEASILLKEHGSINAVASEYSSSKITSDGHNVDTGYWKKDVFNTHEFVTDQIIVNKHKLNPYLYELTDFKKIETPVSGIVGNFCLDGTVLVKAWDTTLKKYVLIRRRLRTPMFFPQLNVPEIPDALNIIDKTKLDTSGLNTNGTTLTLEQYRASEIGKQNVKKSNSENSPLGQNTDALEELKGQAEQAISQSADNLFK